MLTKIDDRCGRPARFFGHDAKWWRSYIAPADLWANLSKVVLTLAAWIRLIPKT